MGLTCSVSCAIVCDLVKNSRDHVRSAPWVIRLLGWRLMSGHVELRTVETFQRSSSRIPQCLLKNVKCTSALYGPLVVAHLVWSCREFQRTYVQRDDDSQLVTWKHCREVLPEFHRMPCGAWKHCPVFWVYHSYDQSTSLDEYCDYPIGSAFVSSYEERWTSIPVWN